jgi:hypothetical protein
VLFESVPGGGQAPAEQTGSKAHFVLTLQLGLVHASFRSAEEHGATPQPSEFHMLHEQAPVQEPQVQEPLHVLDWVPEQPEVDVAPGEHSPSPLQGWPA